MYRIVGLKRVDFTSKKDNKHISGYTVFYLTQDDFLASEGYATGQLFINDDALARAKTDLHVDDSIEVYFNEHKRIVSFMKYDKNK